MDLSVLIITGVVALIVLDLWRGGKRKRAYVEKTKRQEMEWQELRLSDENIEKKIVEFENAIITDKDLPDAIRRTNAYIFRFLMVRWYRELAAKNRYNSQVAKQIKSDMLTYMDSLKEWKTSSFLSAEAKEEQRTAWEDDAQSLRQVCNRIEDAFAFMIGSDAREELEKAKSTDIFVFSDTGEPAPEGYIYGFSGGLERIK
jgi:FtsZ-interacting cell division protein ZipA